MHARSKSFELAPEKVDDAVSQFKDDHLDQFRNQKGYKGFTLLGNRATGKVTGISYWEDEADIAASDELGKAAAQQIHATGGAKGEIAGDQWEVLLDDMA
jgi:heme-degrading monooxygenase HmoA